MNSRFSAASLSIVLIAPAVMCIARPLADQVPQTPENSLTPVVVEAITPAQRSDAQNQCIGRTISGGVIVTVGSFLIIKAVSSGQIADDSPPSKVVVVAISLAVGAGYVLWKSKRCESAYNGLPAASWPPVRRVSGFNHDPVGFDPFARSDKARRFARVDEIF
jgi:hypothetical protein